MMQETAVRFSWRHLAVPVLAAVWACGGAAALEQSARQAPEDAAASGRLSPAGEPGTALKVSGVVVDSAGTPVRAASIYAYQTDAEGYYGVKPASDNRNPRLKILLRSDAKGAWSFDTIKPGSYPGSRVPAHIHFEVSAPGFATRVFEIVFEGDPFVTAEMRRDSAFSVRPIESGGRVTERIVLTRSRGSFSGRSNRKTTPGIIYFASVTVPVQSKFADPSGLPLPLHVPLPFAPANFPVPPVTVHVLLPD
jgi:hypothetical protein